MLLDLGESTELGQLRLTSPLRTLHDLAATLCLVDLVVVVDSALRAGSCEVAELHSAPAPVRGAVVWRQALGLTSVLSESVYESLLRLIHQIGGFEVEPQRPCYDPDGGFVGRGDLWLVGTSRVAEFDGGVHRDARQQHRDLARDRRFAAAGLQRFGYTAYDVHHHPQRIIRDAETAYGLAHDPQRVLRWLESFQVSLFTPYGRRRLAEKWTRADRRR